MPFFRCTICECGGDAIAQDVMVTLGRGRVLKDMT